MVLARVLVRDMDSNNSAEKDLIWSQKNSSRNVWRWFLAGTLFNLTVTSLIVGSMLFYVHVELQSVKDQKRVTTNDATLQQGTPEVNDQTWKKAQLRMRRDHEPQMSTEGNLTFQSGIHTSQTGLTCRDGKDGKDGRDGRDGKNGEVGRNGVDGRDGKNGEVGRDGRDCHPRQPDSPLPPIGQGQPGEPGPPGQPGPPGERGPPGKQGPTGEPVPSGPVGPGPMGPSGPAGPSGPMGPSGRPGPSGPIGNVGPMGPRGIPGESGISGPRGEPGPPGQQGLDGRQSERSGPTYIRWGRTTCPNQAGTELVYQGYGAGAHFTHTGGSADLLCLPTNPDLPASYRDGFQSSRIYGLEYQVSVYDPFSHNNSPVLHDHDVPCAVCRLTNRGTHVLFPAKNECPDNWTKEYKGYLMSAHYSHQRQPSVCVDEAPEAIPGSRANTDGALLYLIEATCDSLQCPPYVSGREIGCTICSI